MPRERLQKILAEAGVASRRASERLIAEGRVAVNGRTVSRPGTLADPDVDRLSVDGRPIQLRPGAIYVLLNKPRGYVTTAKDERGRPTVMDLVARAPARVFPVGRLDRDSEGLLLLTNDGALAQRLTHPRHEVEKEYLALVSGMPGDDALEKLRSGVVVEGRLTASAAVELAQPPGATPQPGHTWLRVVLREGRKRQVRQMCRAVGHPVERLIRTRIGPLRLRGLAPGHARELSSAEVVRVRRAAGLSAPEPASHLR